MSSLSQANGKQNHRRISNYNIFLVEYCDEVPNSLDFFRNINTVNNNTKLHDRIPDECVYSYLICNDTQYCINFIGFMNEL